MSIFRRKDVIVGKKPFDGFNPNASYCVNVHGYESFHLTSWKHINQFCKAHNELNSSDIVEIIADYNREGKLICRFVTFKGSTSYEEIKAPLRTELRRLEKRVYQLQKEVQK